MDKKTKIALSDKELELVCSTEWILTKQVVINKVYALFGDAAAVAVSTFEKRTTALLNTLPQQPPKISRGENYRGLPYVVLDYPRHFTKEETFAIRTLFWWGNFFSVTLQLAGTVKAALSPAIQHHFSFLQQHNYWIGVNATPWEHHFEADNYVAIASLNEAQFLNILQKTAVVKIAKKIAVHQWDAVPAFIEITLEELLQLCEG